MRNELVDSGQQAADSEPVRCGCGGEAAAVRVKRGKIAVWQVQCMNCYCRSSYYELKGEAVRAWNRAMGKVVEIDQYCPNCGAEITRGEHE